MQSYALKLERINYKRGMHIRGDMNLEKAIFFLLDASIDLDEDAQELLDQMLPEEDKKDKM